MKLYERKFDEKETKFFIGNKYYFVDVNENVKQYRNLFGPKLWNIEKVYGRQLKEINKIEFYDESDRWGVNTIADGKLFWKGKIDITIEGLLSTAYQLTGKTKFKSLFELIDTIFGQAEPNTDNYWAGEKYLSQLKELGYNINIIVDFNYIYNDTLDLTIEVDWFK